MTKNKNVIFLGNILFIKKNYYVKMVKFKYIFMNNKQKNKDI